MSYDHVFPKAKAIERLLRKLGYSGKGIHELVTSAGDDLPRNVSRAARKVASIRNKLAHDDEYHLTDEDLHSFLESAEFVIQELEVIWESRQPKPDAGADVHSPNSTGDGTGIDWKTVMKVGLAVGGVLVTIGGILIAGAR